MILIDFGVINFMVQIVLKSRTFHLMIFIHVLFLDPLNPIEPLLG